MGFLINSANKSSELASNTPPAKPGDIAALPRTSATVINRKSGEFLLQTSLELIKSSRDIRKLDSLQTAVQKSHGNFVFIYRIAPII
jgi:hypothetical protein